MITLDEIRSLSIAHTDQGDFYIYEGKLTREFLVKGTVLRKRAGLCFIKIGDETFSFACGLPLQKDDTISCIIRAEPLIQNNKDNKNKSQKHKKLQTSQATFIIQSIKPSL
ncbi:MAG: hypothetical protein ACOCQQ_01005 [Candidatus Nanoarchaeia archaeon]